MLRIYVKVPPAPVEVVVVDPVKYGLLYNWYAVTKNGGTGIGSIAPTGYHVPSQAEWEELITFLGGGIAAGDKVRNQNIGNEFWYGNTIYSNSSGLNLKGSSQRSTSGTFSDFMVFTRLATITEQYGTPRDFLMWSYDTATLIVQNLGVKGGRGIRVIKDNATDEGSMSDIDGNIYSTVKIGSQVWITENLKVTHFNDGTIIPEVTDNTAWAALITGALCAYNNDWSNV